MVDASGNVFVSGYSGQLLEEALSNGEYSQSTIAQVSGPLAMDGGGNLYVAKGNLIKETLSNGAYTQSQFNAPGDRPSRGRHCDVLAVDRSRGRGDD